MWLNTEAGRAVAEFSPQHPCVQTFLSVAVPAEGVGTKPQQVKETCCNLSRSLLAQFLAFLVFNGKKQTLHSYKLHGCC